VASSAAPRPQEVRPRLAVATAPAFPPLPEPIPVTTVTAADRVVDLRPEADWRARRLGGARRLDDAGIRAFAKEVSRVGDRVIVVCDDGVASSAVAERLVALTAGPLAGGGPRPQIGWLDGGMGAWTGATEGAP
jgi:rhodanese-related sulfurtransferase